MLRVFEVEEKIIENCSSSSSRQIYRLLYINVFVVNLLEFIIRTNFIMDN